jgi:hypothetical protein
MLDLLGRGARGRWLRSVFLGGATGRSGRLSNATYGQGVIIARGQLSIDFGLRRSWRCGRLLRRSLAQAARTEGDQQGEADCEQDQSDKAGHDPGPVAGDGPPRRSQYAGGGLL